MKFKYYIRGFGVGVIVSTIIFTIAFNMGSSSKKEVSDNNETSSGSIIAFTKEESTQETFEQSISESVTESETQSQTENATESKTENKTENKTESKTEEKTSTSSSRPQKGTAVSVHFYGVTTAYMASDLLYEAGIIDDKDAFFDYMHKTGYSTRMRDGDYTILAGDSYENIAKIITQSR